MKMLLSVVAVAGLTLSCDFHNHVHAMMAQSHESPQSESPRSAATAIAGQWTMSLSTPHGPMKAALQVKQDGTKITGTCDLGPMGSMALNGTVDGKRISFAIEMEGGQKIVFSGVVTSTTAGAKMTGTTDPEGGEWTATRV
jgi:hypothetical protein